MTRVAQRMSALSTFYFATMTPKIQKLEAEGVDVIRLHIGSPDLPPPDSVLTALSDSAKKPDHHGYVHHKGTPALRKAWATMYQRCHGVELDPDTEIVPLLGSKEGVFHFIQAIVDPGDIVLLPDPGYATYMSGALFTGGEPHTLVLRPENGYLPDLKAIPEEIAKAAKLMWLNYPNNPTGAVATQEFFKEAVKFARENNLLLCHDAAYIQVTFDGFRAPSVLEIDGSKDVAVEFNTLSKSHNMAGWRTGAVFGNPTALEALYRLKTHADSGHFLPIHEAAIEALTGDQGFIKPRNDLYQKRRDIVVETLDRLGADFRKPKGALYVWCACPKGWSSVDFTQVILGQTGVSFAPGMMFGEQGEGYMRISLCAPEDRVQEAMQRVALWWKQTIR
jgi:LL-diaminopimelate aminotransferase